MPLPPRPSSFLPANVQRPNWVPRRGCHRGLTDCPGATWDVGVAATQINGARAARSVRETIRPPGTGYTKPDYDTTTSATLLEIETASEAIIDRFLYPTLFTA